VNVYAPVASHGYIKIILGIAAAEGSILKGEDASKTYLYDNIDITILIKQHNNSSQTPQKAGHVCNMHKSLFKRRTLEKYSILPLKIS